MPNHKDDITRIRHMLDFAEKAVGFNKGRSRADLDSNEMLAMATIHLIEVIGEASRSVSGALREKYPKIPWEAISGTRNRLAHGYILMLTLISYGRLSPRIYPRSSDSCVAS